METFFKSIEPDPFLGRLEFYIKMQKGLKDKGWDDWFLENCDIVDLSVMYFRGLLNG